MGITFIFSLALLQQQNWHANIQDNYGEINNITFSPNQLIKNLHLLQPMYGNNESENGFIKPEFVFHDSIPLKFVELIIVANINDIQKVQEILNKYKLEILVKLESDDLYKSMTNLEFIKYIDQYNELSSNVPNYCYTNVVATTPYDYEGYGNPTDNEYKVDYGNYQIFLNENPYTLKNLKYDDDRIKEEDKYLWNMTLQNCGIKEEYKEENQEHYYKMIENKMEDIYFGSGIRPKVLEYPPFKYTPEYYNI